MALKFRKTIKLLPGVKINLSNSGVSTTVGVRGASVNMKRGRKTKATVGIPGSGLSYSQTLDNAPAREAKPRSRIWLWICAAIVFFIVFKISGVLLA